jgi:hypothetical protein
MKKYTSIAEARKMFAMPARDVMMTVRFHDREPAFKVGATETLHTVHQQNDTHLPHESVCVQCDKGDILNISTPHEVIDTCDLFGTAQCRKFNSPADVKELARRKRLLARHPWSKRWKR